MDLENPFYIEVLSALDKHNVNFILVGGLAVGFHGYARYTGDMDLWLEPSHENMSKLSNSLIELGYDKETTISILASRPFDHPTPIRLFDFQDEFKVDLMTTIYNDEFSFEICRKEAVEYYLNGIKLNIVNISHLISIKEKVRRYDNSMKDLIDAYELKKILARKKK